MYEKLVGGVTSLAFGLVKSARLLPRLLLCHLANAKKLPSLVTVLGRDYLLLPCRENGVSLI